MEKISVEKQKQLLIKMLQYIDDVCRKSNIKYSLIGGSLIGVIRHKGFIPWDDDIDIILDVDNYNKLLKELKKKHNDRYDIFIPLEKEGYYMPFAKLIDKKTTLQHDYCLDKVDGYGLFLDIFCYNYVPNNRFKQKLFYKKLIFLNNSLVRIKLNYGNLTINRKIIRLLKNLINTILGYKFLLKKAIKHFNKYSFSDYDYVVSNYPVVGMKEEIQNVKNTKEYIDLEFEGHKVMVFKNYNAILKNTYGNYMQLPPEKDRVAHNLDVYWKE